MVSSQEIVPARDMSFENIMHKKTARTDEGFSAMLKKDKEAQRAAVAEYFQHWDNKEAKNETEADRAVSIERLFSNLRVFQLDSIIYPEQLLSSFFFFFFFFQFIT